MPVEEEPPIPASPADPALPLPLCGEVEEEEEEEEEGGGGASARAGMARGKLGAGLATEAKLLLCCGLSCTSLSRRKEPPPPDPWDAPPLLSLRPLMLMRCLFKLLAPPLPALEEPNCTTVKYSALHSPSRMDSLASAMWMSLVVL